MEAHTFTPVAEADVHTGDPRTGHLHAFRARSGAVLGRTADLVLAALLLLILAPVLLAVTLAIRLDSPGPALFRQRRLGRGMRPFMVNKFRTMGPEADEAPHREYVRALIGGEAEPTPCDGSGDETLFKLVVDDRVTRVGRFLRRYSLDEMPQLFNVVLGHMSLVGPRPVIEYEVELYPAWYHERFAVKPGLTGLWQVSGRNEKTYEEMVELDVEYVRRRSAALDALILIKTGRVVLGGKGAA
jgi:lipopolysaccharide/colanic/teichoic acid biosynthesis glycosyltransferase